jgi:hypothetical protein
MKRTKQVMSFFALTLCCSACGLQTDSEALLYDDIPYGLAQTSTTSTSIPAVVEPPGTSTTTIPENQRTVDVVYVRRISRELESIKVDLPIPVSGRDLLDQLSSPPIGAQPDLQTEVSRNLVLSVAVDRGIATVNLSRTAINQLGSAQQRRAIAQIVLTMTLFTSDEGGIGQVVFLVSGEPISVYVPLLEANSDPGQPVAWTDFSQLLVGVAAPKTTSTTTTTTQSAVTTSTPENPASTTSTTVEGSTPASTSTSSTSTTIANN